MLLSSAAEVYKQLANELETEFRATYRPAVAALQLLALSPLARAGSLADRLRALPMLRAAVGEGQTVAAIQAGYPNGDYFILRPLRSVASRSHFAAPAAAAYMVDSIDSAGGGGRQLQRLFYDRNLSLLQKDAPAATDYDPRRRPWYTQSGAQPRAVAPYLFYFMHTVGTTLTVKSAVAGVVIGIDISLEQVSQTIARHQITTHSEAVLIDPEGRVLAYRDSSRLVQSGGRSDTAALARLSALGRPVLAHLAQHLDLRPRELDFSFGGRRWIGRIDKIARASGLDLNMLIVSPVDELLSHAVAIRRASLLTTLLITLLAIPVIWLVANRIASPLRRLSTEAERIRRFEFDSSVTARSHIREVDTLARAMHMMKSTIAQFLVMINSLAGEKNLDPLLARITGETMRVSRADAALTFLVDEDGCHLQLAALQRRDGVTGADQAIGDIDLDGPHPLARALGGTQPEVLQLGAGGDPGLQSLQTLAGDGEAALVAVPLRNRQNDAVGMLCLLYRGHYDTGNTDYSAPIAFMRALSGFAALTIESRHLLNMQEALLDAFIKLIAGAIDAKSPYTGGHCQRVPELTAMLARAACESDAPPFRDFRLSDEEWEALHIAGWLHDCGKVTTPEYVVDKATKLETLHDRIHEIRMRFEVLKRDAQVQYWKQRAAGAEARTLQAALDAELAQLDDDFAFVATCNQGGEFMAPERIDRLRRIAARTWTRTLDDRLGVSWEELQRKQRAPAQPLPTIEPLIADKAEHLIEREESDRMPADNPWGFRLDVPEYKYNRGELYNLEVARGTLSAEERYKINDHIVQTVIMLEKLPYPKHLRGVPRIAGCHHETMDGKGYPKRLTREQMSLPARMMAIADIFEALTASDRPYKKAKTLSEAIRLLSMMRDDRHIDPDLFELFLISGVWGEYGKRFLKPEQLDDVDIGAYLHRA